MNYFRTALIIFVGIFIPVGAQAQFIQSMCPPTINVKNNATDALAEWALNRQLTKDDDGQFPLARILFSCGDPVEIAYMAPLSDQTKTKNGLKINKASWNFRLTDEEIWISCEYKDSGITWKRYCLRISGHAMQRLITRSQAICSKWCTNFCLEEGITCHYELSAAQA